MTEGNFVDYVKVFLTSGNGGKGSVHLHREKYITKGGPDGGDGGRGGHIILRGNQNLWTLVTFKFKKHFKAGHGEHGSKSRSTGADGEDVYIIGIMEHIEPCGVHSGDSNSLLPPFNLGEFVMQQIKDHTKKIALALNTVGLINIQFAIKDDTVYIIEANPRASRTVPFIAKAYGEPYVNYATKVMLGEKKVKDFDFKPELEGYAIKQPVFSFNKFHNVNKKLGPEMKSTGESILFIDSLKDDQFYDLYSRRKMYLSK